MAQLHKLHNTANRQLRVTHAEQCFVNKNMHISIYVYASGLYYIYLHIEIEIVCLLLARVFV